jgi:hypothetical protein
LFWLETNHNGGCYQPDSSEEEQENEPEVDNEDEFVDIMTVDKVPTYSSDSDDDELYFLPTVPEPDPVSTREYFS